MPDPPCVCNGCGRQFVFVVGTTPDRQTCFFCKDPKPAPQRREPPALTLSPSIEEALVVFSEGDGEGRR